MIPLQILCAATEAAYASIAQALSAGGAAVCQRVATLVELEAALSQAWDAVIATAIDGAIDPLFVLHRVRALNDVPFWIVGDRLSATEAVKLIKSGADDYIELANLPQLSEKIAQLCPIKLAAIEPQQIHTLHHQPLIPLRQKQWLNCQRQPNARKQDYNHGLERSQMQAAFSFNVASLTTVSDAAALLPLLCKRFGWDVSEVWVATAPALVPIAQWCSPTIEQFDLDCTPPKAIMPSSTDALRLLEPIEARFAAADAQGLQSVWSVPICAGSDRFGTLIFYSRKLQQPQPDFLKLVSVLATGLGRLLKRQQSELALQQLEAIVAATDDAVICVDLDGRILSWQGGAERIYGYTDTEAIGQQLTRLIRSSDDRLSDDRLWHEALLTGTIAQHPVKHQRKTGELIDVLMTLSLIRTSQGISGVAIIVKLTAHHALDRLKDELISTISHELRTPIAALHGAIELLLSGRLGELNDRGLGLLHLAARNSDRLVQLTNNIFDLEQFAAGRVELLPQPCQLVELIEQAAIAVQSAARAASIDLRLHLQSAEIFVDPKRITQVLTNLLSNAIKFSAAGDTIWLTIEQRSHLVSAAIPSAGSAESYVVIQVKDQGRGIPANRLEAIFQRFGQADASDTRPQSGAGLGLSLCRSIARRHQGHLWVESQVGQGSSFYLALPIAPTAFPFQPGNTKDDRGVKNLLEVARGSEARFSNRR